MKQLSTLIFVLLLASIVSALSIPTQPHIYNTYITPFYAYAGQTLTCNYAIDQIVSDQAHNVTFNWYVGGIWTPGSQTYSNTVNGETYQCRVNYSNAVGSTGYVESSNSVTINESCINPYPQYYVATSNTNITSLPAGYNFDVLGNYSLRVGEGVCSIRIQKGTVIRLGGDYYENLSSIPADVEHETFYVCNPLADLQTAGDFVSDGSDTDGDESTKYTLTVSTTPGIETSKVGTYPLMSANIPANALVHYNLKLKTSVTPLPATVRIYFQDTNNTYHLAKTYSTTSTTYATSIQNLTAEYEIQRIRINLTSGSLAGTSGTATLELYSIETQASEIIGTVATTPTTTKTVTLSDITTQGSHHTFTYRNEENNNYFNTNDTTDINTTVLKTHCTTSINTLDLTNKPNNTIYRLGFKSNIRKTETLITYDDGSDYYRDMSFCTNENTYNYYLIDAVTNSPSLFTFTIDDQTDNLGWETGKLTIKRIGSGTNQIITTTPWQADNTALLYLIPNREYSITIVSSDCLSERNIGYITSNPLDLEKTITVTGVTFNTTKYTDLYDYVVYNVTMNITSRTVKMMFQDTVNETEWMKWTLYNKTDDTIVYSDNTTSKNYVSTYVSPDNTTDYYAVIQVKSDQIYTVTEGTIEKIQTYLSKLEYDGELAGLHSNTFYLILALLIITLTALGFGPNGVGICGIMICTETLTFSILGWIPLFETPTGSIYFTSILIITAFLAYTTSRVN